MHCSFLFVLFLKKGEGLHHEKEHHGDTRKQRGNHETQRYGKHLRVVYMFLVSYLLCQNPFKVEPWGNHTTME